MTKLPPLLLRPALQHYAWGDDRFIPQLLATDAGGNTADSNGPCAEAWFGAHPRGPATVDVEGRELTLIEAIDAHGGELLGPISEQKRLPYLLKLLAAARPLSIQVHPNRAQAAEGFADEERRGVPIDAGHRNYRDASPKPELIVALTPFTALAGFRAADEIEQALARLPEIAEQLPAYDGTANGLKQLLRAYFSLPDGRLEAAWAAVLERLQEQAAQQELDAVPAWALRAQRASESEGPDRGLLFVFLLELMELQPGQAMFLAAGVPHAYLQGAGVELMACSDNVLRAGLTSKHVDPAELLRVVRFDAGAPPILEARGEGEARYSIPELADLGLTRVDLADGEASESLRAAGPETLLVLAERRDARVELSWEGGELSLASGQACLVPAGCEYSLASVEAARVFRVFLPSLEHEAAFVAAVRHNISVTERLFDQGQPPGVIGTVAGSEPARQFWQRQLDLARPAFRADRAVSFHEDLPVNQAFGLLLLWQRLRPELKPGLGALIAFVFGEGTRATPFTEAECGQKPALSSFVSARVEGGSKRQLSVVELALRYFAPVESFLRRSGFDGIVVKWGDEVQIPTLPLDGTDSRFAQVDVVRFVSIREMNDDDARNKDWVGVDDEGRVTAFVPRRPLAEMERLADRGLLQRRGGQLFGGVNLGSIGLSRALLDVLLAEFEPDVNDVAADRKLRPDLDPQLFTALTIAALPTAEERELAWRVAAEESPAMAKLHRNMPDVLSRLRRALDVFEAQHGRKLAMRVLDFGDQYWGDIGQHRQMYELYTALRAPGARGQIARALAGVKGELDERGNLLLGDTQLGASVKVEGSVLVDAKILRGNVRESVLIGTQCGLIEAHQAFDVQSTASELHLAERAGAYKVVAGEPVRAAAGERLTTVFLPSGAHLLRVREDTDLRDRATFYDAAILDNSLSFAEAHDQAVAADPQATQQRRERERERVCRLLEW